MLSTRTIIVCPTLGAIFAHSMLDQELAWRLLIAYRDASDKAEICSSQELCKLAREDLRRTTVLVVNPRQCIRTSGNESGFCSALAWAQKRILASSEPVESAWYGKQLEVPMRFNAVFDIGFLSQRSEHPFPNVPYHFIFNGPTKREKETIAELSPPHRRPIPWALVGYPTADRLDLAAHLTEEFDPGGFVFMPGKPSKSASDRSNGRRGLGRYDKISPRGLAAILSRTSYYVWTSAHDFAHYESLRFVAALRAGTVPCTVADVESLQKIRNYRESSQLSGLFAPWRKKKVLRLCTGWPKNSTYREVCCLLTCRRR